jgi:beta-glucanase (GH16 family)
MLPAALLLLATGGWFSPASARTTTLSWQGYSWVARTVPGNPGAPQQWSASNVSIDNAGRLHLKVTRDKKGRYAQAELDSIRNGWGYGTYRWQIDTDVSRLAPEYVLGLFTYSQDPAYGHREIDIEASGWGSTPITWDYTTWANGHNPVARTPAPAGPSTQQFDWAPDHLVWTSWDANGNLIATATATGADVPVPYDESLGINLWLCGCESGWDRTPATEVVISSFKFTPATA